MEISKQSYRELNQNRDIRLTRQEVLKADSDGDGQLSTTEGEKAKIAPEDLPALNRALQGSAALEPSTVLFAMSGKLKSMPAQIPVVKRIEKSADALETWRGETANIIARVQNKGTESQRRAETQTAIGDIVQQKVQWRGNGENKFGEAIGCANGPFLAYVMADLISVEEAKHLMGDTLPAANVLSGGNRDPLLLETLGIDAGKPIPEDRLYKGPNTEPFPKAVDVAVFVENDAQGFPTHSATHYATFTGNGWEVMSLQGHTDPPSDTNPAIFTTIEDIWAGDFKGTSVVICPFPFKNP
jgi:hypothetical protein